MKTVVGIYLELCRTPPSPALFCVCVQYLCIVKLSTQQNQYWLALVISASSEEADYKPKKFFFIFVAVSKPVGTSSVFLVLKLVAK